MEFEIYTQKEGEEPVKLGDGESVEIQYATRSELQPTEFSDSEGKTIYVGDYLFRSFDGGKVAMYVVADLRQMQIASPYRYMAYLCGTLGQFHGEMPADGFGLELQSQTKQYTSAGNYYMGHAPVLQVTVLKQM